MTQIRYATAKRIVFVSLEPWDEVWRRNQFVCRELAERGWELLFVEPAADWSAGLRRRDWSQFQRRPLWSPEDLPRIRVARPVKIAPRSMKVGRSLNARMMRFFLDDHVSKDVRKSTVLWINDQSTVPLAKAGNWGRVIYDVTDDWTIGFKNDRLNEQIRLDDMAMCQLADTVIVCSEQLQELKQPIAQKVELIPNGVKVEHYATVGHLPVPGLVHEWRKPVLMYTGSLHPARLDMTLLKGLAKRWPGTVALVGPDYLGDARAGLQSLQNIVMTGAVPYQELPSWMSAASALIVPHLVTPFTESLNPLKLWEYLASGLPVVSTPVAGFRGYPNLVALAETADSFLSACERAVSGGAVAEAERRAAVADHSWAARVDRIEQVITGGDRNSSWAS